MIVEDYVVVEINANLLTDDGYGILHWESVDSFKNTIKELPFKKVDSIALQLNEVAINSPPAVILPSSSNFIGLDHKIYEDNLLDMNMSYNNQVCEVSLLGSTTQKYVGGIPQCRHLNYDEWLNFQKSTFKAIKAVSVRAHREPKVVFENLQFSNQTEFEAKQKELKTLRSIVPDQIQLKTECFPLFFSTYQFLFFKSSFLDTIDNCRIPGFDRTKLITSVSLSEN